MEMESEQEIFADVDENAPDILTRGGILLSEYGWFLFAGLVVIVYYWKNIQKYLNAWYRRRAEREYEAKYHKNPDLALERLEGVQKARDRMQEEHDRKAKEYEKKRQDRERQKALDRIAKAELKEGGQKLGDGSSSSNLKPEYNPLMSDSGSRYKPQKRSGCSKGGCGGS